jgi:leucyl-tRNA synthetase
LPEIDKYLPTETGEPPLARAEGWKYQDEYEYELSTMPGWAGSSWYWYRYMDAQNSAEFASPEAVEYWKDVDLYIGGSEHATGHLLYSRFWNKFLKDIGLAVEEEPFKKLINQGMIQGRSSFTYRLNPLLINTDDSFVKPEVYVSKGIYELYKEGDFDTIEQIALFYKDLLPADASIGEMEFSKLHVDVNIVHNDALDIFSFRKWRPDNEKAIFILEDGGLSY